MLTAAKNQFKVCFYAFKYALMREMINKTTFLTNIIFMILNNGSLVIQWLIFFSLKDNIGGYGFKEVIILWAITASSYGLSRLIFRSSFHLSDAINSGKLDAYLVQPKNVLLSFITSSVSTSAIGDVIFGYIMFFIFGFTIVNFILFTILSITGAIITVAVSVIYGSLAFWFQRNDILASKVNDMMIHFGTYPEGIFRGVIKFILYTFIPVAAVVYLPVKIIAQQRMLLIIVILGVTVIFVMLAFMLFYRGLRRYSSTSLMIARI